MIGIDEIGVELEEPFKLLPLQQLSSALTLDVVEELVGGAKA
jgi:predicted membrane chloride channel (bestrophin family)